MSYITPITDRTAVDVANKEAKGYFNVADWVRIYGNALLLNRLMDIVWDTVTFNTVTTPTTATIPQVTGFNTLLKNIDDMRASVVDELPSLSSVKYDWVAGVNQEAPKYTHVNQWETTIDAIWDYFGGYDLPACPVLTADLVIPTGTTYIVVECIDPDIYEITLEGNAVLHII